MTTALLVAAGAGVGGAIRFLLAELLDRPGFPWGIWLVNVVGSGLLGGFAGLALTGDAWAFAATGLCGGLTTYSTFAVGVHDVGWQRGSRYAALTIVPALLCCALGFWLTT